MFLLHSVYLFQNEEEMLIYTLYIFQADFLSVFNLSISFRKGLFIVCIIYELPRRRFAYRISLFFCMKIPFYTNPL